MKLEKGAKYKKIGGGYYIYHGIAEDGQMIAESNGKIFKLRGQLKEDMLPEIYNDPIWYTKIIYLKNPPGPTRSATALIDFLMGNQTGKWWHKKLPQFPVTVRITVETIEEGE